MEHADQVVGYSWMVIGTVMGAPVSMCMGLGFMHGCPFADPHPYPWHSLVITWSGPLYEASNHWVSGVVVNIVPLKLLACYCCSFLTTSTIIYLDFWKPGTLLGRS